MLNLLSYLDVNLDLRGCTQAEHFDVANIVFELVIINDYAVHCVP